jgi:hypothetical protein
MMKRVLTFPELPSQKMFGEQTTPEQDTLMYYFQNGTFLHNHESIISECTNFYRESFKFLRSIPLSTCTLEEIHLIKDFLKSVYQFQIIMQNDIQFRIVFRVTAIRDEFLEEGKVRKTRFLNNPPVEILQELNRYGRCNSPDFSVFYCSFYENVAIRESMPPAGAKIILTIWENCSGEKFVSFPISNSGITHNEGCLKATEAFEKQFAPHHPLFRDFFWQHLNFLAEEFIKSDKVVSSNKFEYLYSAFFSEFIFKNNPRDSSANFDMILYPSVAFEHYEDNACISPHSMHKLRPVFAREFEIQETYYQHSVAKNIPPVKMKEIRHSTSITDTITWNDD